MKKDKMLPEEKWTTPDVKTRSDYIKFIKNVLKYADEICFYVNPYLENLEELLETEYSDLYESAIRSEYTTDNLPIQTFGENFEPVPSSILHLKVDYRTIQFFLGKKNLFDFKCDWFRKTNGPLIFLQHPFFLHDGEFFCYTETDDCLLEIESSVPFL